MPKSKFPYIRIFTLLILIIGGCEYAIMILFDSFNISHHIPAAAEAFLDAISLIITSSPLIYFSIIRPLSKQRAVDQHELKSLMMAMDGASDSIMVTNHLGDVFYVNQAFTNITGYHQRDVIGKNPRMLQSGKQNKAFYQAMWATIETTGEWEGELWTRRKDGSEYLESLHIKTVQADGSDESYYVGITCDITEKRDRQERLAHNEKMATVGTLVGGIAHHFNNLLSAIVGNAYLAQDKKNTVKTNERLQLIERISFDASEMVKSLLIFAGNHHPKKKNTAIISVLQNIIKTIKLGLDDSVQFTVHLPDNELIIYCDTIEIQQVMLNLISNAHDALPEQGERSIDVDIQQVDWDTCSQRPECDGCSAHMLKISVKDSGSGISDDVLPHIFDPFFTTKEVGKGTGLGLSTTFASVQSHGGKLTTYNLKPQGCCFEVCLPLALQSELVRKESNTIGLKNAQQNATILIVDDELIIRNTLRQIVESLGYTTLLASEGQEALDVMKNTSVDLLISDIVMPILDGVSSVKIMRKTQPQLPVIFITSYEQKYEEIPEDTYTRCISKPFDINTLSQENHDILND